MSAMLTRLLAGTLPDPDSAGMLSVPVRSVVTDTGLAARASDLIAPLELGAHVAVIADPATRMAMGADVAANLSGRANVSEIVLRDKPYPDMDTVNWVRDRLTSAGRVSGVVSVGSGTVNDIGKHAAHLEGLPFAVFGTAPSMNGYTSVSAAITEHGHKLSLASTAPRGVFLDLDVLAHAPQRLIAAGFGDSICRSTAQADWLAAHLILDKPYRNAPFLIAREEEDALVASAADLARRDRNAIGSLARTLVMSGLGMTICGGSYPASQAEHLISHFIDMLGDPAWPESFHGEHIAVTTLTVARLQEKLFCRAPLRLAKTAEKEADLVAEFGASLGASCWQSFSRKRIDGKTADEANERLQSRWPEIQRALRAVMRPSGQIEAALRAVNAPVSADGIGVPLPFYRRAVAKSRLIRDRFTCLDFAAGHGILNSYAGSLQ